MIRFAPQIIRIWLSLVIAILGTSLLFLLAALFGGIIPGSFSDHDPTSRPITPPVYVISNLLHSDFAIPVTPEVKEKFQFLAADGLPIDDPSVEYLVIGWGATDFYTSTKNYSDMDPANVFKGITGDSSVIHVQLAVDVKDLAGFREVPMNSKSFSSLLGFIKNTFANPDAVERLPDAHFTQSDAFYKAKGHFNIFNPCNQWITQGLRAAGFGTGIWTPTSYSLKIANWLHGVEK